MQFCFVLILTFRPLLHVPLAHGALSRSNGAPVDPAAVCTLAAANIAKLVRDYQQYYSLRRISSPAVHFAFIAATIHIVNFQVYKEEKHHFLLQGCLAALAEMGESYPIGRRAVAVLNDLIQRSRPGGGKASQEVSPISGPGGAGSVQQRSPALQFQTSTVRAAGGDDGDVQRRSVQPDIEFDNRLTSVAITHSCLIYNSTRNPSIGRSSIRRSNCHHCSTLLQLRWRIPIFRLLGPQGQTTWEIICSRLGCPNTGSTKAQASTSPMLATTFRWLSTRTCSRRSTAQHLRL